MVVGFVVGGAAVLGSLAVGLGSLAAFLQRGGGGGGGEGKGEGGGRGGGVKGKWKRKGRRGGR